LEKLTIKAVDTEKGKPALDFSDCNINSSQHNLTRIVFVNCQLGKAKNKTWRVVEALWIY
jgi:hypothetical protein